MRIDEIEWTVDRAEHIGRHAITPDEVEDVLASARIFKRGRGGAYDAWGQTESGRYYS